MYRTEEQETTINIFPANISDKAEIYTCIPGMITRMKNLAVKYPQDVAIRDDGDSIFCTVPIDWVKVSPKRKCTLTDEQKRANAERLAAYWEEKRL